MMAGPVPTRRFTVKLGGQPFSEWTKVEVSRDLEDMAGKFTVELRDAQRSWKTFPFATIARMGPLVEAGLEAEILLDGVSILHGWVNEISPSASEGQASVSISGCDKTADLCDCAASVDGPFEYYDLPLEKVAEKIAKPYGLKVKLEADAGKPFPRYAIDVGETALSAIEKAARQRGLLVTSDGRDGLVLTQSGNQRAGGDGLTFPGNVIESSGKFSASDKWSEYHVKGQAERAGGRRRKALRLDVRARPARPSPDELKKWIDQQQGHEAAGTSVYGMAKDGGRRYRPLVSMARTQLDREAAQKQAEWMARSYRARCDGLDYVVKDYYAAPGRLWRPNELVPVSDAFQNIDRDMLIAGVAYQFDEGSGAVTRMRLTSPDSYDTKAVGNRRKNSKSNKPLDGTANPLA